MMRVVLIECAVVAFTFAWPLSLLVYIQVCNIYNNSTTKARFSKSKYKLLDDSALTEMQSSHFIETLRLEQEDDEHQYAAYNSMLTDGGGNLMGTYRDCVRESNGRYADLN